MLSETGTGFYVCTFDIYFPFQWRANPSAMWLRPMTCFYVWEANIIVITKVWLILLVGKKEDLPILKFGWSFAWMFYESAGLAFRIFIDFHKYFLPYPKIMKGTSSNYYSNIDIPLRFCTDRTESFCQALLYDSPLFLRTKNGMCFRLYGISK